MPLKLIMCLNRIIFLTFNHVPGDTMQLQDGHEVVISGIGVKLPESNNIKEFGDKLFSKSVLLSSDWLRWVPGNC